jgi:hypothetical protein
MCEYDAWVRLSTDGRVSESVSPAGLPVEIGERVMNFEEHATNTSEFPRDTLAANAPGKMHEVSVYRDNDGRLYAGCVPSVVKEPEDMPDDAPEDIPIQP